MDDMVSVTLPPPRNRLSGVSSQTALQSVHTRPELEVGLAAGEIARILRVVKMGIDDLLSQGQGTVALSLLGNGQLLPEALVVDELGGLQPRHGHASQRGHASGRGGQVGLNA